jgi:hypothetical protein
MGLGAARQLGTVKAHAGEWSISKTQKYGLPCSGQPASSWRFLSENIDCGTFS